MGCVDGITATRFPRQGTHLGKRVEVAFQYDTANAVGGVVVRDDLEEPYETIIRLDDGRHVLSSECQYALDG